MPPTARRTPEEPTATATLYRALRALAERLSRPAAPPDGLLSARVIGEFSAGKTRLLRELLGEVIPPALFPVSSLERQTRLPLEITYGENDADRLVVEFAANPAHELQTGVFRFHDHVQQDDRHRRILSAKNSSQ